MGIIDNAINYVMELFKNEYSGHDYFHTLRVHRLAKNIAEKEQANTYIVELAALLHDVDDYKLSPNTYKNKDNARDFLTRNNVDSTDIDFICHIIDQVSFKGKDSVTPDSMEAMIVQDADRLDAIGAIGIARAFAYGGNHNRVMYDPNDLPKTGMNEEEYRHHVSTTVNHFYEKLFLLKDMMNTKIGKTIAQNRHQYMVEYIELFKQEWDGLK